MNSVPNERKDRGDDNKKIIYFVFKSLVIFSFSLIFLSMLSWSDYAKNWNSNKEKKVQTPMLDFEEFNINYDKSGYFFEKKDRFIAYYIINNLQKYAITEYIKKYENKSYNINVDSSIKVFSNIKYNKFKVLQIFINFHSINNKYENILLTIDSKDQMYSYYYELNFHEIGKDEYVFILNRKN